MLTPILLMFSLLNFFSSKDGQTESYSKVRQDAPENTIYNFSVSDINGKVVPLSNYKGKVVVIVNVASECGYTPQYKELQQFYEQNKDKGVVVLGFPANNFGGQEPGNDETIKSFCEKNYNVTFPMFSKISVSGNDAAPLYQFLTSKEKNGVIDAPVKWNFNKFLVDRRGRVVTWFESKTHVTDQKFLDALGMVI
jgi:glutathione peroxidase